MTERAGFEESVRDNLWSMLNGQYETVRHGGHPLDRGEYLHRRAFWPDMRFLRVELAEAPDGGGGQLRIAFSPSIETGKTYGYKVDIDRAAAAWSERVGVVEPRSNPSMFAAELIWYMVAYIGSIDIAAWPEGEDGVRWINLGSDVFAALPDVQDLLHRQ